MLATLLIRTQDEPDASRSVDSVSAGRRVVWISSPPPAYHQLLGRRTFDDSSRSPTTMGERRADDTPKARHHPRSLGSIPFSCSWIGVRMAGKEHPVDVFVLRDRRCRRLLPRVRAVQIRRAGPPCTTIKHPRGDHPSTTGS